ncbi:unnamed protein product [Cuscuta campestris]|uniref:Reverse transcriptase domain-containing protein n=1 Tax=Cuscuta campestris TaxID=132261 RepID=A0A484M9E2_9ASTE|nr:unnamed protein product [Cuscuta campestris]
MNQNALAHVRQPEPRITLERLKKNGAEEFLGENISDPLIAFRWLERVRRVFENLKVPDREWANLAVILLQSHAYEWWKRTTRNADHPAQLTWAYFEQVFKEEYIVESFVEEKREEFLQLEMGTMSLLEYRQMFDHLAEFGQDLVNTTKRRCDRFVKGMRPKLQKHMSTASRQDFGVMYEQAKEVSERTTAASQRPQRPQQPAAQQQARAPARTYAMHGRIDHNPDVDYASVPSNSVFDRCWIEFSGLLCWASSISSVMFRCDGMGEPASSWTASGRTVSKAGEVSEKNWKSSAVAFMSTCAPVVVKCFLDFYTNLFGNTTQVEAICTNYLAAGPTVPISAHSTLLASVSLEEVREVVFDIRNDKAPGPDGYTAAFFKNQWPTVGKDVYDAVLEFFTFGKLLKQINHAMIVLLPKSAHNPSVKDFRPIACLNVLYKIITKILARRMAPLLSALIDPALGAFVKGRSLVDNLLLAQHLIRDYAIKRCTPSCMIKLDITKAYNTVSWSFLWDVLVGLGFPTRFAGLIMECVSSASSSLMINGNCHGFFNSKRGLRQGDPMAPTLFLFCIEYLSRVLNTKAREGVFNYHKDCVELGITHLAFADDLMLFSRGDFQSVQIFMDALSHFSSVSADYAPLFKSVDGFLSKWATLKLSYAGKLELIRAVIQGVQSFWLQAFPVQKYVLDRITALCRNVLWGSKFAKVAWVDVCEPKTEGGLGLRDVGNWNNAMLCKLFWNLEAKKDSIWVKCVHCVYLKQDDILQWQPKKRHTVFFKRLAYVRGLLIQKLGDHIPSLEVAMQTLCMRGNLVPSKVYDLFRVKANPKPWMSFMWHSTIPPKCSFTMWLALRRRLPTKANLEFLGLALDCTLCGQGLEDVDHLFFQCSFSRQV